MPFLRQFEALVFNLHAQNARHHSHRTVVVAASAADAWMRLVFVQLILCKKQNARCVLENRNVKRIDRESHHRAARNDFRRVFLHAARKLQGILVSRPYLHAPIAWIDDWAPCDCRYALVTGNAFRDRVANRGGRPDVLHYAANIHRQTARGDLPASQCVNQLLFSALRIADIQLMDFNVID